MAKRPRSGSRRPHSYSDYRRLSPAENVKAGYSAKSRHYVLKSVQRVTKRTSTITARAHETLRTRQVHGFASPEIATKAREREALGYQSARAAETAQKTRDAAYLRRLRKAGRDHRRIEGDYKGHGFRATPENAKEAERSREQKLRTGFVPDQVKWLMMIRFAEDLGDPMQHILPASPTSFTSQDDLSDE
jgi:hypothetical protein